SAGVSKPESTRADKNRVSSFAAWLTLAPFLTLLLASITVMSWSRARRWRRETTQRPVHKPKSAKSRRKVRRPEAPSLMLHLGARGERQKAHREAQAMSRSKAPRAGPGAGPRRPPPQRA